jgi:adenylate cyclase
MRDNEDETVHTITAYRAAIAKLVEQYRGRVVDSPGDNILVEFGSGLDAVNCAVEIQRELAERNEELADERKMKFRIGVNSGDVIQEDERIYGDGVNIAARIESLAEGGGISISGTVYDSIEGKLGLEFENLGEHEVKNIDKPIRVYRILSFPGAAAHRVVKAKRAVGKTWRNKMIAIAAVLIITAAAWAVWQFELRPTIPSVEPASVEKMAHPLPDKPSIAVLPFANISGDPKEDYLSDGITDAIITGLSKTPEMFVIARNSVFTYKGKPVKVKQVSEDLGVRYVLEGSVQKEGDRLRINVQLIDAVKGHHLWAEKYDRDLKDLFALQDDITKNVITALQVKLTEGEIARILSKGTDSLEAYLMVMKGVYHNRRFNKDDNEIAQRLFDEAIGLDPDYANAYVFLAWTYYNEPSYGRTKIPANSYEKAMELAKKAISLDEKNALAYTVFANVYAQTRQFEKAAAARKKALALDPANSSVIALSGMVLFNTGKFKEAILFLKKAIRIDPKHPSWYVWLLGVAYTWIGQNEKAIAAFNKWVSRDPENADAHAFSGVTLIVAGKPEEAIAMFEKALGLNPNRPSWYAGNLAVARAGTGQTEEAITTMREVFNRNPKDADSCRYLSAVLIFGGRHEEALVMAKKAVSLKEMSPSPDAFLYDTLGTSYRMMGQYEEAIAAFKKAIDFWPEYIYGRIGLTASYSLAGRMEVARAQAAEVLKINPKITMEDIAKNGYFDYKKTDKERFINALRKAGLK